MSTQVLWLDHLRQDVRSAWRGLTRYPIACAVAVLSLAAGIGSTTATLTIRNAVFRNAPPLYVDPEQLSRVRLTSPTRQQGFVPGPLYVQWAQDAALRAAIGAAAPARSSEVRAGDRFETLHVRPVTPELFSVLGVAPALGRMFDSASVETAGATPVVLSHRVWARLFDARSDAPGSVIWIDKQPHAVIGVMPRRFWFSSMDAPIWKPLDVRALGAAGPGDPGSHDELDVVVRHQGDAGRARLADRLQGGLSEYASHVPADQRQLRVHVSGIEGTPLGRDIAPYVVWLLGASVLLTLLIACTNVAILMIAQWTAREHEIAIRASLGASRIRVVRALLTESVLIAVGGGTLGICATYALRGLIVRGLGDASLFDLSIDPGILVQSMVVTLFVGILTGIAPALYETRRLHLNPLRLAISSDRVRQRWRHTLVVFEIAGTVALMVVTTAMVSAYRRTLSADPGYDTHVLLAARVEHPTSVPTARILDLLTGLPGVASAAAASAVPIGSSGSDLAVAADATASNAVMAESVLVSPEFLTTLGVPLRAGRGFGSQDTRTGMRVAIVNEVLAEHLWPSRD